MRNGDHDTHFVVLDNHLQSQLDAGGGTLGQEDLGGIGSESITLLDELGNILADVRDTLGVGIGTDGSNVLQQQLGAIDSIAGVDLESKLSILILEKLWVFGK